jgi:hypothetical protein
MLVSAPNPRKEDLKSLRRSVNCACTALVRSLFFLLFLRLSQDKIAWKERVRREMAGDGVMIGAAKREDN